MRFTKPNATMALLSRKLTSSASAFTNILLLSVLFATPLQARQWASAGGWDVAEIGSDMCGMALEYEGEGETILVLGLSTSGSVVMTLSNYRWSIVPDRTYKLVYLLNGAAYTGGESVGFSSGIRKGFVTNFEPDFLKHFAASSYLTVESEDGVLIDDLKLNGSAAGLAQVSRCVAHRKALAAAEARKKAKFAHIPSDPFAELTGEPVKELTPKTSDTPVPSGSQPISQGRRIWLQLASSADEESLQSQYARITARQPALFESITAHVSSAGLRSRLLIGPFYTEEAARLFADALQTARIDSFRWISPPGTVVRKLEPISQR
ncbi:MAG: SPOR domain-containing protein [Sphingomicrobium sp.]